MTASTVPLSSADCPAGTNIIVGNNAANTLTGTVADDCIVGLGGSDTIDGLGGNDFLIGGVGEDRLYGASGNDTLHGEDGFDRLEGGEGDDALFGENHNDTILGGEGHDVIHAGAGNDSVEGGGGNDSVFAGVGVDTVRGGDGNDRIFGDADPDYLYGDGGNDIMDGAAGGDLVWGGAGNDVIQGGTQNDNLNGESGDDAILGGGGANTIVGADGSDRCTGHSCEFPEPTVTGCSSDAGCSASESCVADLGVCLPCSTNQDGDGACDDRDECPTDPTKVAAGVCGCGVSDADPDGDLVPSCIDGCPSDGTKAVPGICGCGISDTDTDGDAVADCLDSCPLDPAKAAEGICGCGYSDADTDDDGAADCVDLCEGFDDAADDDADGIPDGCEAFSCDAASSGPGVHQGDAIVDSPDEILALEGIRCITGELSIRGVTLSDLTSLAQLRGVAGGLTIAAVSGLTTVAGLESLESIGGTLLIVANDELGDLDGLRNLRHLGGTLEILSNPVLPGCWTWLIEDQTGVECRYFYGDSYWLECTGNTGRGTCGELPEGFVCERGARGPGVYHGAVLQDPLNGSWVSIDDLGGVTCIVGAIGLIESNTTNFQALSNLRMISGTFSVKHSHDFQSLEGLERLESVSGTLEIVDTMVTSLEPLLSLRQVGSLRVSGNWSLPQCWVETLETVTGLTCGSPGDECIYNWGEGTCPPLEGGDCGDTTSDADNCGACGYACVNGRSCVESRCTPAWQEISAVGAPQPRSGHAAVALSGKYVVLGGTFAAAGTGPAVSSSGRYDPATDTWDAFPSLTQARCLHSAIAIEPEGADAHILAFGGLTDCSNGTTVGPGLEVSVDGGAWQVVTAAGEPAVRYNFAAVPTPRDTFGADLFIYGGSTNTEPAIASGAAFTLGLGGDSAEWTSAMCTLPQCERGGHFAMFVDGDRVRVWGGGPYGNAPAGLQYSAETKTWSTWELPANTPTLPQRYADDGRRIYFLSATSSACPHSVEVLIYDRTTSSWQTKDSSEAPAGLVAPAAVAWVGSELIAWSGNCGSGASSVGARYQPPAPGL